MTKAQHTLASSNIVAVFRGPDRDLAVTGAGAEFWACADAIARWWEEGGAIRRRGQTGRSPVAVRP
jgi:hypothetical protein